MTEIIANTTLAKLYPCDGGSCKALSELRVQAAHGTSELLGRNNVSARHQQSEEFDETLLDKIPVRCRFIDGCVVELAPTDFEANEEIATAFWGNM